MCLKACTTTLNQFSVMGGGGEGGRRAVDNGWEGVLTKLHLSMHSTISGFRKLVTSTSLCAKDKLCETHKHTHTHTHTHTHMPTPIKGDLCITIPCCKGLEQRDSQLAWLLLEAKLTKVAWEWGGV